MAPQLKTLLNQLEQVVSAHTTTTPAYATTSTPADTTTTPTYTTTTPEYTTATPACTALAQQAQEPLVPYVVEPEQGTSGSFMQHNQLQHLQTLVSRLQAENKTLHTRISNLSMQCTTLENELKSVKADLAALRASPPTEQTSLSRWHQRANNIIGAQHSRVAPTHAYQCVHVQNGGCTWRNKRVTLQAYVLHLQRKHRQNISSNPNMELLPVRSSE